VYSRRTESHKGDLLYKAGSAVRSLLPLGALLLLALVFAAAGAKAQQHPSARIESLGGDAVSGIIPDTLTDIHLNPAYLHRCRRLTIDYGQRWTEDFSMRFPRIVSSNSMQPQRYEFQSLKITELSLYGLSVGSWRMGLSAGWYLDFRDSSEPEYTVNYSDFNVTQNIRNTVQHRDHHNYSIDISISRALSAERLIGFRAGGYHRNYANTTTQQRVIYDFEIVEEMNEIIRDHKTYVYDEQDDYKRVSSIYLQAGLAAGEGHGEKSLLLRAARYEIYSRCLSREIYSWTYYDPFENPYRYSYDDDGYRDERCGTLWRYDIRGRFPLPFGIRICAGGAFEHMGYDTDWYNIDYNYNWTDGWEIEEREEQVSLEFGDEGDYKGFSFFLKAGRTVELRSDLKITAGMHSYVRWARSEEDPVALATVFSRLDSALINYPVESPIMIATESTDAMLSFPIAIEYEPSGWISIWSGFRIITSYKKEKDRLPNIGIGYIVDFIDPAFAASFLGQQGPRTVDGVSVSSSASVGFSLHYRNRFFVDLYTGSDMTPDYLTNYILDVRYAF
jgi:hypothetical protein